LIDISHLPDSRACPISGTEQTTEKIISSYRQESGLRMKVLFLEQFSELGGGQRNLLDLLPVVSELGWKALVAAPGAGPLFDTASALAAETARITLSRYTDGTKTRNDMMRFALDTIALSKWIGQQNCDLISVGGARALVAAAFGARRRPVIFQAQHFLEDARALRVAKWAVRRANATVVANSRHVASQFSGRDNVSVVYNGVEEIPFVAHDFGRRWRIGVIGRIAPMKGQTDFLRAAAAITPSLPGVKFVICGAPMFTPATYVDEVNRLAIGLPVDFLGWRNDVGAVLRDLDLLLVPSTVAEATTRVILEAFSAGVPVVAYAIGGIPEIVRDGENGFLVPECEARVLARKVLEVIGADLRRVVKTARTDWERNYTVARYRREMAGIMNMCAQARALSN
jgi:glycosyltransferase involved in cell wall biosynthesis